MGNAPSSSSSSALLSSPPPPPHVPSRGHSPSPGDAPALKQGYLVTSKAQPAQASSLSSGSTMVSLAKPVRGERDDQELEDLIKTIEFPAEEAEGSQEATLIVQETPFILEDHSPYQPSFVSSDWAPSLVEDASDTQSEHLTTFTDYLRSDTPHAILDDIHVASSTPFLVTDELEGQRYSSQDEEAQSSPLAPGKCIPWGSVEAQLAYTHPQQEEEYTEELPSPRALAPALPPRVLRAERAARLAAAHRHVLSVPQKVNRELKPGLYTATDAPSLDLSGADHRSQIELSPHGWKDQQVSERCSPSFASILRKADHYSVGIPVMWYWFRHQEC